MKFRRPKRRIGLASRVRQLTTSISAVKGYTDEEAKLLKYNDQSNILVDPFSEQYDFAGGVGPGGAYSPIAPDYDLRRMAHIMTISNILRQCVEAMVTNTTAYGYTLEYIGPEGKERAADQQEEKRLITSLLSNPSPDQTLREILERFVWDKEVLGFRALELIREDGTGPVVGFNHVPAISIRKTKHDRLPTVFTQKVINPETGEEEEKLIKRRFRRYVQKAGKDTIYFKEAGDPRDIDMRNGQVMSESNLPKGDQYLATELIFDEFYTPGSAYGQPRWMGVLPAILGSRESELVNLNFFRENAIPAMAVLVSGGTLTAETFDNLSQYIQAVRGKDAMQRIMILEASAEELGSVDHSAPAPRIELKPMISERQQDGLFKDYDNHNIVKIRSSFRLPPILVGKAEDYTRASALASVQTAENQVFSPERSYLDDLVNNKILSTYNLRYWRYRSNGPATTDAEELAKVLESLGEQGALTPNVVIKLANKMLGVYIEPVLEKWGDYPFSIIEQLVANNIEIDGLNEFIKGSLETAKPAPVAGNPARPAQNGGKTNVIPLAKARRAAKKTKTRVLINNTVTRLARIKNRVA